jgi:NAD(P)-dependent dehydrogenase (short-subunit alcohol dehydrogenase family)
MNLVALDVTDPAAEAAVQAAVDRFWHLDVLVNKLAVSRPSSSKR